MSKHTLVFTGLVLGLAACHKEPPPASPPPPPPVTIPTPPSTPITVQPAAQPTSDRRVNIGKSVREACGIDDVDKAPKFDFDAANLSSADRDVLQKVSDCATNGKLRGKTLVLIGRADPRGPEDHNQQLGQLRAENVRDCLVKNGVDDSRINITSAGSSGATGYDESTWAKDRRVDVEVAGLSGDTSMGATGSTGSTTTGATGSTTTGANGSQSGKANKGKSGTGTGTNGTNGTGTGTNGSTRNNPGTQGNTSGGTQGQQGR